MLDGLREESDLERIGSCLEGLNSGGNGTSVFVFQPEFRDKLYAGDGYESDHSDVEDFDEMEGDIKKHLYDRGYVADPELVTEIRDKAVEKAGKLVNGEHVKAALRHYKDDLEKAT